MRKDDFTTKCIVVAAIFKDSDSGVIPVPVDKIRLQNADHLAWG